jgi:ankyrin repeat protein
LLTGCGLEVHDDPPGTAQNSGLQTLGPPAVPALETAVVSSNEPEAPPFEAVLTDDGPAAETATSDQQNGLAASIKLKGIHELRQTIDIDDPFEVVLTNASDRPIWIWAESTENGYYQFSFLFRNLRTGKMHLARKRWIDDSESWERNEEVDPEPTTIEIGPHASRATRISFSDLASGKPAWNGVPELNSDDQFELSVQFDSRRGEDSPGHQVWAGRILSQPVIVRLVAPKLKTPHDYLSHGFPDAAIAMMSDDPKWITTLDERTWKPLHHAAQAGAPAAVKWLLDHGADVNAAAISGATPLSLASDAQVVELLLQKRPNLDIRDSRGQTPLQHAVGELVDAERPEERAKWNKIAGLFLDWGADCDLLSAIGLDDLPRVKQILKEHPDYVDDFQNQSPLRTAARLGRLEICRCLIETRRVDLDDFKRGFGYPIIKGALAHPQVVELLIESGADLKTRITWRGGRTGIWIIGDDATALHYAAEDGVPETINLLIDSGVDIFATAHDLANTWTDQTALEVAAFYGKAENASAILNHPKFSAGDEARRQALLDKCLCIGACPSWLAEGAQRPELVEVLLDARADPNAGENGVTAMQGATSEIHPSNRRQNDEIRKIVALLAERGAPVDLFSAVAIGDEGRVAELLKADPALANSRGPDGYPALHFAVGMNYIKIVAALLNAGGEVDIRNKSDHTGATDETALHCAAFWGRYEIAKRLIAAGADVNALSENNDTPLHDAMRMGNENITQLLRENGGRVGEGTE